MISAPVFKVGMWVKACGFEEGSKWNGATGYLMCRMMGSSRSWRVNFPGLRGEASSCEFAMDIQHLEPLVSVSEVQKLGVGAWVKVQGSEDSEIEGLAGIIVNSASGRWVVVIPTQDVQDEEDIELHLLSDAQLTPIVPKGFRIRRRNSVFSKQRVSFDWMAPDAPRKNSISSIVISSIGTIF